MRRKLVSWTTALRKWSNQAVLASGMLPVFWMTLPDRWQTVIIEWKGGAAVLVASALSGLAFYLSNVRQPSIQEEMKKAYVSADESSG